LLTPTLWVTTTNAWQSEEELLWDLVEEALASVLPHPTYVPATMSEETTLARLVQKKITDWTSYGKV
jgi:hypothetical protein